MENRHGSGGGGSSEGTGDRRSLLYAVVVLLLLMLVLSTTGHLLQVRPAALIGFPVIIIAITALILVLLVVVAPMGSPERVRQEIVDRCFLPAVAVDAHSGELLAGNGATRKLLELPDSSAQWGSFPDLLADDTSQETRSIIQRALDENYAEAEAAEIITGGGERITCDLVARTDAVLDDEFVVIALRPTEKRDPAAEFDQIQERLMSNVSHELRNILNVVLGFSELMISGKLGELPNEQHQAASECHAGGQRMLRIVDDILDVGRIRSYAHEYEITEVDPREIIERIGHLLDGQARRDGIILNIELSDALPRIRTFEPLLKQLIYHLILNSINRSRSGEEISVLSAGNGRLTVEVSDSGPMVSIPPRPAPTTLPSKDEAGESVAPPVPGLPLCATLAERLRGDLYVSSDAEGVHFVFEVELDE